MCESVGLGLLGSGYLKLKCDIAGATSVRHLPRERFRQQRHPEEPREEQALGRETLRLRVLPRQVRKVHCKCDPRSVLMIFYSTKSIKDFKFKDLSNLCLQVPHLDVPLDAPGEEAQRQQGRRVRVQEGLPLPQVRQRPHGQDQAPPPPQDDPRERQGLEVRPLRKEVLQQVEPAGWQLIQWH